MTSVRTKGRARRRKTSMVRIGAIWRGLAQAGISTQRSPRISRIEQTEEAGKKLSRTSPDKPGQMTKRQRQRKPKDARTLNDKSRNKRKIKMEAHPPFTPSKG